MVGRPERLPRRPTGVPVWAPYLRSGSPINNPTCARFSTGSTSLRQRPARRVRSFGVRGASRGADAATLGSEPRRIVASGGGIRVDDWLQALADATRLPVESSRSRRRRARVRVLAYGCGARSADCSARGAALGVQAVAVEPRPEWLEPVAERYERFRRLSDALTEPTATT
jgi:xylulokinase